VDYADVECILLEDGGNEEGQIQHQTGRRGGMQCLLCDGIRILSEAFKQLKVAYKVYGRVAAVYGNTCNLRERAKMSAARESFTAFVGDAGCTQPHRQVRKKVDNSVVPLILLPMNTTKVDVFHFVNEEVKTLVGGESMSLASFHRLW
jgi:hypothetical protein